jgi:uncharacterized glyoxalase superfamily protein PhnB
MSASKRPALTSGVFYQDPRAALLWLEKAFGFEPVMVILDSGGVQVHAEMRFGDGLIMVGGEWNEASKSPKSIGGCYTQSVHVQLDDGIDDHYQRAVAAGAVVMQAPQLQFYGDTTYRVLDPEGHMWTFGQTTQDMSEAEMAAAGGVTIKARP